MVAPGQLTDAGGGPFRLGDLEDRWLRVRSVSRDQKDRASKNKLSSAATKFRCRRRAASNFHYESRCSLQRHATFPVVYQSPMHGALLAQPIMLYSSPERSLRRFDVARAVHFYTEEFSFPKTKKRPPTLRIRTLTEHCF